MAANARRFRFLPTDSVLESPCPTSLTATMVSTWSRTWPLALCLPSLLTQTQILIHQTTPKTITGEFSLASNPQERPHASSRRPLKRICPSASSHTEAPTTTRTTTMTTTLGLTPSSTASGTLQAATSTVTGTRRTARSSARTCPSSASQRKSETSTD